MKNFQTQIDKYLFPIAIHMICAYLFDGLNAFNWYKQQRFAKTSFPHVNELLHFSIAIFKLHASDRFTWNAYENKSHNYICPLEKWYWFFRPYCIDNHTQNRTFHDSVLIKTTLQMLFVDSVTPHSFLNKFKYIWMWAIEMV